MLGVLAIEFQCEAICIQLNTDPDTETCEEDTLAVRNMDDSLAHSWLNEEGKNCLIVLLASSTMMDVSQTSHNV